jgi:predicted nucleic acid-binding Zn ribbon protein
VASQDDDALKLARSIAQAYRPAPGTARPSRPQSKRGAPAAGTVRKNREDPTTIGHLLGQVVQAQGWTERLDQQRIYTDWVKIVGPEVSQHAKVDGFADGVVHVRADKTAWAKELKLLAPRIVAKLNEALGEGSVLRLEIRGPQAPSWKAGSRSVRGGRGPRDTYG